MQWIEALLLFDSRVPQCHAQSSAKNSLHLTFPVASSLLLKGSVRLMQAAARAFEPQSEFCLHDAREHKMQFSHGQEKMLNSLLTPESGSCSCARFCEARDTVRTK